jgi:hypothetical protein
MKTNMNSISATLLLATAVALNAGGADQSASVTAPVGAVIKHSPEFERMKTLVGTWKGTVDIGQGPVEMVSQYKLLAGGSVLEEKCFAGTPNEMTTMYYDKDGRLALTHYCMMGNRPSMVFKSSDARTIRFDFDKACGINPKKESHMHALSLTFEGADTITASCRAIIDGREMEEKPTTLKRVKSS